jgi:hypothetical protein
MRIAFEPTSFLHAWMIIQPPDDPSLKRRLCVVTSQHPLVQGDYPVIPFHNTRCSVFCLVPLSVGQILEFLENNAVHSVCMQYLWVISFRVMDLSTVHTISKPKYPAPGVADGKAASLRSLVGSSARD